MALSDETKKKLLVGGGVGGLALLVGYFLVSGPKRAEAAGPPSPRLPDGSESRGGGGDPRQPPMGQAGLPAQPFAHPPAQHHMRRRRHDEGDRDQDRCNERGEYGRKHKKHKKRGHG